MDAGSLKDRVTIYAMAAGTDDLGQPNGSWGTLATVWAHVRYLTGIETVKNDAQASVVKASIRIRRRTDVTAAMRVVFGSVTFNVLAVLPDAQSRETVDLVCEVAQ